MKKENESGVKVNKELVCDMVANKYILAIIKSIECHKNKIVAGNWYVYVWYNADKNKIFHVGIAKKANRFKDLGGRNNYFLRECNKYNCYSFVLVNSLSRESAGSLEKYFIQEFKTSGECYTNIHAGGFGGDTVSGMSEEDLAQFKQKISLDSKSKWKDPIVRNKIINGIKKYYEDPNNRTLGGERTKKGMWEPEHRANLLRSNASQCAVYFKDGHIEYFESTTQVRAVLNKKYHVHLRDINIFLNHEDKTPNIIHKSNVKK